MNVDVTLNNDFESTCEADLISKDDAPFVVVTMGKRGSRLYSYLSIAQARQLAKGLNDALYELDGPAIEALVEVTPRCAGCGVPIKAIRFTGSHGSDLAYWTHEGNATHDDYIYCKMSTPRPDASVGYARHPEGIEAMDYIMGAS